MKHFCLIVLFLILNILNYAAIGQDTKTANQVSGIIRDIDGIEMIGVTVYFKGTQVGTSTDFDGSYELTVTGDSMEILVASFMGYITQEVKIEGRTNIDIVLEEDRILLEEVVITGYQQIKSERATGSYGILNNNKLDNQIASNVVNKMEGAMSGVLVNEDNTFEIRGISTLFGNDQPLVVIDGLPVDSDLSDINPEDIEQITVLKDAASAAIYGVRSSNGVIVVTTKSAKAGSGLKIDYSTFFTLKNRHDLGDYQAASAAEIVDLEIEYIQKFDPYTDHNINNNFYGYTKVFDIIDQMEKGLISQGVGVSQLSQMRSSDHTQQFGDLFLTNEFEQNHTLSLRGSGDRSRYYFSAGYVDNKSGFVGDKNSRWTLNLKNDISPFKWLDIGVNIYTTFTKNANNSIASEYMNRKPYELITDENGDQIAQYRDWSMRAKDSLVDLGYLNWDYNPIKDQQTRDNTVNGINLRMSGYLKFKLTSHLNFTSSLYNKIDRADALNFYSQESYYTTDLINRMTIIDSSGNLVRQIPQGGISSKTDLRTNSYTFRNQLDFAKEISKFYLTAVGGMEIREQDFNSTTQKRYGVDQQALQSVYINNPAEYFNSIVGFNGLPQLLDANSYFYDQNISELGRDISYYSNVGCVFDYKYSVTGSFRYDQSNLFGVDKRLRNNPLWSVGLLWNIDRESFIKNSNIKRLDLKVSYGVTGNVKKDLLTHATAAFGTTQYQEIFLNKVSSQNDGLGHEDTKTFNIGTHFAAYKWLSGSIEYFNKVGSNLLGRTPIDYTFGWLNAWSNYASTKNQGMEFTFNFDVIEKKDWSLNLGFNATFVQSNVIEVENIFEQAVYYAPSYKPYPLEGYPVNSLFAFQYGGVDNEGNGIILNNDGEKILASAASKLKLDDLVHVGSVSPTYFGGLSSNLQYKKFTLELLFTYKGGHVSRMPHPLFIDGYAVSSNTHESISKRWEKVGDENIEGVLPAVRPMSTYYFNEDFGMFHTDDKVFDADHLRFKKASLSYKLNNIKSVKLVPILLYGEIRNIALLTKNKLNIDPDYINPFNGELRLSEPMSFIFGIRASI